jgi:hypothetical protein
MTLASVWTRKLDERVYGKLRKEAIVDQFLKQSVDLYNANGAQLDYLGGKLRIPRENRTSCAYRYRLWQEVASLAFAIVTKGPFGSLLCVEDLAAIAGHTRRCEADGFLEDTAKCAHRIHEEATTYLGTHASCYTMQTTTVHCWCKR